MGVHSFRESFGEGTCLPGLILRVHGLAFVFSHAFHGRRENIRTRGRVCAHSFHRREREKARTNVLTWSCLSLFPPLRENPRLDC